jgi:glycolate oxidase FAD binding subunit
MEAFATAGELAARLGAAAAGGARVRAVGGGTKLDWGAPGAPVDVELSTAGLRELREHVPGEFVAVVGAGLPLAELQERLAGAGERLALDPPLQGPRSPPPELVPAPPAAPAPAASATVGGVVATGDSGPLRHRYGAPRDLVLGVTVALSDGTLARAGGKVIKNVAGYDLAKLLAGSFGTLGVVVEVALRLHPLPGATVTAVAPASDPARLAAAAGALAHERVELESLDVRWSAGDGAVLARAAGPAAPDLAAHAAATLRAAGLEPELVADDDALWERQRAGQRARPASEDLVVRVSGRQSRLGEILSAARRLGGEVVGRAAPGLCWVRVAGGGADAVRELRRALDPLPCVVLDAPAAVREAVDPWGDVDPGLLELTRRVKARFDPAGALAPGRFVGAV